MANVTRTPSTIATIALTGQVEFIIPFEYLARRFIDVTLIGADRRLLTLGAEYRFIGATKVSLQINPPSQYTHIELRRNTSATDRLVDFRDGSILRAGDLNISQVQTIHVAEEARTIASLGVGLNEDGHLDAKGRRIVNLAYPVNPQDAVPYGLLSQFDNSTESNAIIAEAAAKSAVSAKTSAQVAEQGAIEAEKSAWAAKRTLAPAWVRNGGQMGRLHLAIKDALIQNLQMTFIGDSITWGVGASGNSASGTRDKTLSDPRNNSDARTYVNEFGRWVKEYMGEDATVRFENHYSSTSGESVRIIERQIREFPLGTMYSVTLNGSARDNTEQNISGPLMRARRSIAVAANATAELSFKYTGDSIGIVTSLLPSGGTYELIVNGMSKGLTSCRDPQAAFGRVTQHSFDYVKNKTVTIKVAHDSTLDSGTQHVRVEGLLINKKITIKNQGLSGINFNTYINFNMPETLGTTTPVLPKAIDGFTAVYSGTGTGIADEKDDPEAILKKIQTYGTLDNNKWTFTLKAPADKDKLVMYFHAKPNAGFLTIKEGDEVLWAKGLNTGAGWPLKKNTTFSVLHSKGASLTLELTTDPSNLASDVEYIDWAGVAFEDSEYITYPDNNKFNDGLALDVKDNFAFIQLGINDRANSVISAPTVLRDGLTRLVALFPPLCEPIVMVSPKAKNMADVQFTADDTRDGLMRVSSELGIDFIDNNTASDGLPLDEVTSDGLHPNDAGHIILCRNITGALLRSW